MFIDSPLLTGSVVLSGSLYVTDLIYGTLSGSSTGGGEGVGFPFSGSAVITGSLFVSGGVISGDGSGLTNITVAQATSEVETFVNQTNVTVEHNLNSSNLTVAVYNNNGVVIQPGTIQVTDTQVILTFASPTTGKVVITRGGHLINSTTASYSNTSTSASYALTASYALNAGGGAGAGFPFSGSGVITGSLFVSGGTVSGSFVGDGSGLKNITFNESVTVRDTFTTATTKIVTHNFNTKDVVVTTYLDDDTLFFPETITTTDVNTVTLGFNTPTTGRVVVVKGGHLVSGSAFLTEQATVIDTFTNEATKTVIHNFNTKNVLVSVYLDNDFMIIPDSIKTDTANTVTVTLDQPRTGRVVVAKGGHLVSGSIIATVEETATVVDTFTNASSKSVVHNFGTKNVLTQVYLDDDTLIIPSSITTTDINTVDITFDQAYSGRVVVGKAGHVVQGTITNAVSATTATTASYVLGSNVDGTVTTATTASFALTASYAENAGGGNVTGSFTNVTSSIVTHNLGTKSIIVQVWDNSDFVINPSSIKADSNNQVTVTFSTPESGYIVVGS